MPMSLGLLGKGKPPYKQLPAPGQPGLGGWEASDVVRTPQAAQRHALRQLEGQSRVRLGLAQVWARATLVLSSKNLSTEAILLLLPFSWGICRDKNVKRPRM